MTSPLIVSSRLCFVPFLALVLAGYNLRFSAYELIKSLSRSNNVYILGLELGEKFRGENPSDLKVAHE